MCSINYEIKNVYGFHLTHPRNKSYEFENHTATDHKEGEQLGDRRNVGEGSCNFGDGTDEKFSVLDVYDDDDDVLRIRRL